MDKTDGRLASCATSGCGWRCCKFQQGNYIVLYPGELEAACAAGQSTAHLKITDENYHGGKKAVCNARDTAHCDGGLKPLDCVSYPFFPAPPGPDDVDLLIKGKKCPLQVQHLQSHAALVRHAWNELAVEDLRIAEWLNKVELIGYTEPLQPVTELPIPAVPRRRAA
jgi:hypothetical protein